MASGPRRPARLFDPFRIGLVVCAMVALVITVFLLRAALRYNDRAVVPEPGGKTVEKDAGSPRAATEITLPRREKVATSEATSPIDLRFCPQGAQCLLSVRLADLLQDSEGERVVRALGPGIQGQLTAWSDSIGIPLEGIQHAVLCWVPTLQGTSEIVVAFRLAEPLPDRWRQFALRAESPSEFGTLVQLDIGSALVIEGPMPALIVGPKSLLHDIEQRQGQPPLLRRDLEALLSHTSAEDLVTILFVPTFLVEEWSSQAERKLRPLAESLRDVALGAQAGLWQGNLTGGTLTMALRLATTVESHEEVRQNLADLLRELPIHTADELTESDRVDPYWRRLAERFPAMLQVIVDRMDIRRDRRHVVITVALPSIAAHNLVLATELYLHSP